MEVTEYINKKGKTVIIADMHDVHLNNAIIENCRHYNRDREATLNALIQERDSRGVARNKTASSFVKSLS